MTSEEKIEACVARYVSMRHNFEAFESSVTTLIRKHPLLTAGAPPPVHSIRSRVKDPEHLRSKLHRKFQEDGEVLSVDELFNKITDLAGVRLLHLFNDQVAPIDAALRKMVEENGWEFHEQPTAYTWDPELVEKFQALGLVTKQKDSYYTSLHYVFRSRPGGEIACEVQVRTLFEEAWGEIDHLVNYPQPSMSEACRRELKVLARIVSSASRLGDSILDSHNSR